MNVKFHPHGMTFPDTFLSTLFEAAEIKKRMVTCPQKHMGLGAQCYANRSYKYKPKEGFEMEIKTQTLVNGIVLDRLNNSDLINFIGDVETQINTLKKIDTKSDHIQNKIEKLKAAAKQLAFFLDARGS